VAKKITKIVTKAEIIYAVSAIQGGMEVDSIQYKMLGLTGINRGVKDEAHYLIALSDQLNDKIKYFKVIPAERVEELTFVEVEEEKESCETPAELTRA